MCSLSHLHRSLSDVLSPTARIHPALAEPLGGQAAWLGWPLWPAVIAVSAHPETSGQFLSLTPSCLRFAGKANLMAPPSPLWPAPGWSQPVPWTLGLPSLCLQPRRSPDNLWNMREGRNSPTCTPPYFPQCSQPPRRVGLPPVQRRHSLKVQSVKGARSG